MRIETVNRPEILALRAELALLGEKERDIKDRIRHAPPRAMSMTSGDGVATPGPSLPSSQWRASSSL